MPKNTSNKPILRARSRFKTFKKIIKKALQLPNLEDADRELINSVCGYGAPCEATLASDMTLRWQAAKALKEAMLRHREHRPKDRRHYYFGTLVDDCGVTSDRLPQVRVDDLHKKAYRTLKSFGLNALAVIEVHPLMNHPGGGDGRSLLFHVHFIAWTDEAVDCNAIARTINASPAWSCSLGAPPAKIRSMGPTKRDLAAVCYYLLKPPHSAKNRMPSKTDPGMTKLMDTVKGYRPELALRVVEGYSQLDLMATIFSVGNGSGIRQEVRAAIQRTQKARLGVSTPVKSDVDIWLFWHQLRQRFGSDNYLPYRFQGATLLPVPSKHRVSPAPRRRRPGSNQRILSRRRVAKRSRRRMEP